MRFIDGEHCVPFTCNLFRLAKIPIQLYISVQNHTSSQQNTNQRHFKVNRRQQKNEKLPNMQISFIVLRFSCSECIRDIRLRDVLKFKVVLVLLFLSLIFIINPFF